ncbi:hypothetical protein GCM10007190_06890 [Macrococcus hajekii]|nr:DUF1129 family protein [Macrococcus hajekii]GGB01439.1 hypothetical protein GCM10007190_06890 [Macrococcus hajekii]
MKTSELIELNNEKRELLTKENMREYDKVLIYLRLEWRLSTLATEELLNDLLDHLLEAQQKGITTEEFFGDDTELFAKDLIAELPKESRRNTTALLSILTIMPLGSILFIHGLVDLIASFFIDPKPVDVGSFIVSYLLLITSFLLMLNYVIRYFQKDEMAATGKASTKKRVLQFINLYLLSGIVFALFIIPLIFLHTPFVYNMPGYISMIAGGLILTIMYGIYKFHDSSPN